MNGKGSKPRPLSVSYDKYADNFDSIFRKKYTVEVKELSNGDRFIELPEELIKQIGWREGDEINWVEDENGTTLATLSKKKK